MFTLLTDIFNPVQEAFPSSILQMSDEVILHGNISSANWGDNPVNACLIIVSALLIAFNILNIYHIFPHLYKSFTRWRWNCTIEASLQLTKIRDLTTSLFVIPFCLVISRYGLVSAKFMGLVPEMWNVAAILAILLAYTLVKSLAFGIIGIKAGGNSMYGVAGKTGRTFFIIANMILLPTVWVMGIAGVDNESAKFVVTVIITTIYVTFIIIKGEILSSYCNLLTTFLYLCALEFLPLALLIASIVYL